jgi:ribosomal protein S12 methylthiotransferase accessory factor YcaO
MLSLAAFRYRNVLAEYGGPVARIEMGEFPVRGRKLLLANATLKPGLTRKTPCALFSSEADGTGVHQLPSVARHIAISEALERWAFSELVQSDRAADYGFDVDPSTCGMSAFPGLFGRQARRRSVLEAIERFTLMAWWEGRAEGRHFDTDWPGVSAVAIDGPFGGVTVVVYARTQWGGYAYGHAADESFSGACERAILELGRHEWVMRSWWLARVAGERRTPANRFERRCVHFATEAGFETFRRRLERRASGPMPKPEIICDAELPGPWDEYATVWRFALRPPSDGYLRGGDDYFFL